jgi:hypothetical protein
MRIGGLLLVATLLGALGFATFSLGRTLGSDPATPGTLAPPPKASEVRIGLTSGGIEPDRSPIAAQILGARLVRVEFAIGTPTSAMRPLIADYADRGMSVLLLAGFYKRLPSADEARTLADWGREFGPGGTFWAGRGDGRLAVRQIEFGNETSYADQGTQDRGGEYAERFRDAHAALNGDAGNPRVGLLAQADDGGTGGNWVRDMFDAVPDLAEMVDGWTVHPYGPPAGAQERIDTVIAQTGDRGGSARIPIDITEWGVTTDDGRCLSDNYGWEDRCMTYQEAADALRLTVSGLEARYRGRLRTFIIFQATDQYADEGSTDRERFFGALTSTLAPKGAYTTEVYRQLARSAPIGA